MKWQRYHKTSEKENLYWECDPDGKDDECWSYSKQHFLGIFIDSDTQVRSDTQGSTSVSTQDYSKFKPIFCPRNTYLNGKCATFLFYEDFNMSLKLKIAKENSGFRVTLLSANGLSLTTTWERISMTLQIGTEFRLLILCLLGWNTTYAF